MIASQPRVVLRTNPGLSKNVPSGHGLAGWCSRWGTHGVSDAGLLAAQRLDCLPIQIQRSGHGGPPPRHPGAGPFRMVFSVGCTLGVSDPGFLAARRHVSLTIPTQRSGHGGPRGRGPRELSGLFALTPPSPAVTWALLTGRRFAGEGGSARRGRGLAADWIYQPTRGLWDLVQGVAGNSISVRRSILRTATTRLAPRRAVAPHPFHEQADKPVSGSAGLRSGN